MKNSHTLLRVPELLKAIEPLVSMPLTAEDIFRLIGTGEIEPLGYIQRIPVFSVEQIGKIVRKFQSKTASRPAVLAASQRGAEK